MSEHFLEIRIIEQGDDGEERALTGDEIRQLDVDYRMKLLETVALFMGVDLNAKVKPAESLQPDLSEGGDGGD